MILKLKEVSTKPFVKLRKDPFIDQKLTVIGMGAIATNSMNNALANNPLKEAQFGYMENNQCQDLHGYNVEISNDMLCAFEDNKDIWCVESQSVSN